jgi:hypothetical protein
MNKRNIIAGALLGGLLVVGFSSPAFAQNPYTGGMSSNTATPGAVVTYSVATTGFPSTEALASITPDAEFLAANSATYTTSASGGLTFSVRIPAAATPGSTFTLTVNAGAGAEAFADTESITILALPADDGTALTGVVDPVPYLWFGGGLLALGIAVIVVLSVLRRGNRAADTG